MTAAKPQPSTIAPSSHSGAEHAALGSAAQNCATEAGRRGLRKGLAGNKAVCPDVDRSVAGGVTRICISPLDKWRLHTQDETMQELDPNAGRGPEGVLHSVSPTIGVLHRSVYL